MLPRSHLYWYSESRYDPLYLIQGPRSAVRAHLQHNLCNGTSFIQSCALREQNFLSLTFPVLSPTVSSPTLDSLPVSSSKTDPISGRSALRKYLLYLHYFSPSWPAIRPVFIVFQLPLLGFGWRWRAESAITLRFKKPRPSSSRMRNTISWCMSPSECRCSPRSWGRFQRNVARWPSF